MVYLTMTKKELGALGEKIARTFLEKRGYKILDKNYVVGFPSGIMKAEIDIIAQKEDAISFIEVKTLAVSFREGQEIPDAFSPEDKVNQVKQRKILMAAQEWLTAHKIPLESGWQIDIIAITLDWSSKRAKVRHFQNVASE